MGRKAERKDDDSPRRPRRHWWQWPVRLGAAVLAAGVLLYATLPWWAPTQWLARKLAEELSRQTGLPVSVGALRLSWADGVSVSRVRVGAGHDREGEILSIGLVRFELAPIKLLLGSRLSDGRLNWVELAEAEVSAVIDEKGEVNLAPLGALDLGPPPKRLAVRQVAATLRLPRSAEALRLDVSDLQYRSGRLRRIGRVTMSAELAQTGRRAPVTLLASTGTKTPVATGSFRFAGVDISQLHLPRLLGLPLKRLAGIASGQLDCQMNSRGVVEQSLLSLRVKGLDAQPEAGPALPVIDDARVRLSAQYHWYADRFDVDDFALRLPGIDLRGRGEFHTAVLTGGWEGVQSLEASGTVNPDRLAALLAGKPAPLPGRLRVDGGVKINLSLRGEPAQVFSTLVLDATAARLRVGQRVAKPPGRTLSAQLRGSVEKQSGQFSVDQTELRIGANRFRGAGALQNIRRVVAKWLKAGKSATPEMVLDDLAALDWQGTWEIVETASLSDLLGWAPLGRVRLKGRAEGNWSVEHAQMVLLRGSVRVPAETELSVGKWFVKPRGKPMLLEASGDVARDAPRLSRFRLWVGVGESGVSIDEGRLTFSVAPAPGAEAMNVQAEGRFALHDAAGVLACLPAAGAWRKRIEGGCGGRFNVVLAPAYRRLHLQANAARLKLAAGDLFVEEAGQPAEITADFRSDESLPVEKRNRIELRVRLGAADLKASATFTPTPAPEPVIALAGRLRVADARWLLQRMPALRRDLSDLDLRGAMDVTLSCRLKQGQVSGEIACDADDIQFRLPDTGGVKPRGAPLRLRLLGRLGENAGVIDSLSLDVGRSSLHVTGTVSPAERGKPAPPGAYWPPPRLAGVELKVAGRLSVDPALKALLPPLGRLAERFGIEGGMRVDAHVRGDSKAVDVTGRFDASKLGFSVGGRLRKAAGAPAKGRFRLALPADLARIHLRDVFVDARAFQLRGGAVLPLLAPGEPAVQLALTAPDAGALADYLPELASYKPAGGLFVEVDYRFRRGRDVIRTATLTARDLSALVRGKACRLNGTVTLSDVTGPPNDCTVGRAVAESLEWAVGESHGHAAVDLAGLPGRPKARVTLLCTKVDVPRLQQWVVPDKPILDSARLTESDRKALAARTDRIIAAAKRLLADADVQFHMKARELRHFDPAVRAFYLVQVLTLEAAVNSGAVRAKLSFGLNGGQVEHRYRVDLKDPRPALTVRSEFDRLLTGENMLAQLAQEFPDNTFYGTFSRKMTASCGLRDVVMNLLDGRHRPPLVGQSTTIAEDGLIRGRAAPPFVARIFPGLNLTTYRYRRMTGFAEYLPDGSARNDMIFDGANYDIYVDGVTDPDRVGRYEIGVLLLARPQSPRTLHRLRQGRIPILNFKARIENGRFYDEKVAYVRLDEAAYKIFLKNNIFYRLWVSGRRSRAAVSAAQP